MAELSHLLLTRSAYPAAYPIDANRRRLELLRRVTVPSLAAQTERRWTWIVSVDRADPLLDERTEALRAAGVPVVLLPMGQIVGQPNAAGNVTDGQLAGDAGGPWGRAVARIADGVRVLTTRIDDDDAFAVDALARVRRAAEAERASALTARVLLRGFRYHAGRVSPMVHRTNMFVTLESPRQPLRVVMDVKHNAMAGFAPLRVVDDRPGWLWVRHRDTRSGVRDAGHPITAPVRSQFAIDWDWLARQDEPDVHDWAARQRDMAPHVEILIRYARDSRTIIELGVRAGASTWSFLDGLPADGRLWSVDIAPHRVPPRVARDRRWSFIRGDDMDPAVHRRLPRRADLVFIDTSHELEHTKAELAFALSREPARIVCHDAEWPGVAGAVEWFRAETGWRITHYAPAGDDRGPFGLVTLEP